MTARDFYHTGLQVARSDMRSMLDGMGPGNQWYVDYTKGMDTNSGKTWATAFRTYGAAIDAATTNNNDVININGYATVTETSMVSITKSRIHTIGWCGPMGHYGQGAKISLGITTAITDIATVQNTGVRNTFTGVKFMNSNTVAQGLYAFAEGGEFTKSFNCEYYKSNFLNVTGAAELLHNGDSAQYYNCTLGSTANIIADNVIRPNVLLSATLSGKKCRDSYFDNCLFFSKAGGTEHVAVYGANATDVERMLLMKDCTFINNILSAATPAHAVGFGAAQTQGSVLLKNCSTVDFVVMAEASVGIYVDGAVPTFATSGVSVTA